VTQRQCGPISISVLAEAKKASGRAAKERTVKEALGLMIELRGRPQVTSTFGQCRWRADLAGGCKGRRRGIAVDSVFGRP
jgi:hypothetical protein